MNSRLDAIRLYRLHRNWSWSYSLRTLLIAMLLFCLATPIYIQLYRYPFPAPPYLPTPQKHRAMKYLRSELAALGYTNVRLAHRGEQYAMNGVTLVELTT